MNANDVAAAIIDRFDAPIGAVKLQKLLFFVAGEFLALTGEPMFAEPVEAWDMGPVVYDVWRNYTEEHQIEKRLAGDSSVVSELGMACIGSVVERFGHLSGSELIDFAHKLDPWRNTYRKGGFRVEIDLQSIYDYFGRPTDDTKGFEALSSWHASRGQ